MGILIAIEGTDASGKQTQSELLYKKLCECGINARLVSFPAYDNDSSVLVRKYLAGEFGKNPDDVNAYAASVFYAADRFATYRTDWGKDYNDGAVIIADRYVPSNIIHQASKLGADEKSDFIKWLSELEYKHFGLPVPDTVVFLNMPPDTAAQLMADRANKIDNSENKDIHEQNKSYLKASYDNAVGIADTLGWKTVSCVDDSGIRTIENINDEIMNIAVNIIGIGE